MNNLTKHFNSLFSGSLLFVGLSVIFISLFFTGCGPDKKDSGFTLRIRLKDDVDCLHPIVSSSSSATQIEPLIMMPMIEYNMDKIVLTPLLVRENPTIKSANDSASVYECNLREEASWDDGSAITSMDYAFTVKAALNPFIKNSSWKAFLRNILAIQIDPQLPKHLAIHVVKNYMLGQEICGNINLYQQSVYDPEGIMAKYQIYDLINKDSSQWSAAEWKELEKFANDFQSAAFCKSKISGSGPYKLLSWDAGSRIVLQKKQNWWGTKLAETNPMLSAYPDQIEYLIMPDEAAVILALKEGSVDLATDISPKQFEMLQNESGTNNKLQFFTPTVFQYTYVELNTRKEGLSELKVRKALAYLIDVNGFIKNVMKNLAEPIVGPVHPSRVYYNKQIKPIELNLDTAAKILADAGWVDSNKDGILDKTIKGKSVKLSFKIYVSAEAGKKLALLFQENARQVGIEILPETKDWSLILKDMNEQNFDMAIATGRSSPSLYDPYQSWHSSNTKPGGSNRGGFTTVGLDSIIQIIRTVVNEDERNNAYLKFQEILYQNQPQIFLFSPKERLIATNRIQLEASSRRPGYLESSIKLK